MKRAVIDASVAAKWFFPEEDAVAAHRLLASGASLAAPDLIMLEMGNVFWKRRRAGHLDASTVRDLYTPFREMDIDRYSTRPLLRDAMDLAVQIDRSIYDCTYLVLAMRLECPLVTADRRFYDAAVANGFAAHIRWVGDDL